MRVCESGLLTTARRKRTFVLNCWPLYISLWDICESKSSAKTLFFFAFLYVHRDSTFDQFFKLFALNLLY